MTQDEVIQRLKDFNDPARGLEIMGTTFIEESAQTGRPAWIVDVEETLADDDGTEFCIDRMLVVDDKTGEILAAY